MFSAAACVARGLGLRREWEVPAAVPTRSFFWPKHTCPSSCSSSTLRMSAQKASLQVWLIRADSMCSSSPVQCTLRAQRNGSTLRVESAFRY